MNLDIQLNERIATQILTCYGHDLNWHLKLSIFRVQIPKRFCASALSREAPGYYCLLFVAYSYYSGYSFICSGGLLGISPQAPRAERSARTGMARGGRQEALWCITSNIIDGRKYNMWLSQHGLNKCPHSLRGTCLPLFTTFRDADLECFNKS